LRSTIKSFESVAIATVKTSHVLSFMKIEHINDEFHLIPLKINNCNEMKNFAMSISNSDV